jgi:hypothetical protein
MDDKIFHIVYQDGSQVTCDFVEHVPYEPSAYHWDDGIIVNVQGVNVLYFVSCGTGTVYTHADDDHDSLTRVVENAHCPEINKVIEAEREADRQLEDAARG